MVVTDYFCCSRSLWRWFFARWIWCRRRALRRKTGRYRWLPRVVVWFCWRSEYLQNAWPAQLWYWPDWYREEQRNNRHMLENVGLGGRHTQQGNQCRFITYIWTEPGARLMYLCSRSLKGAVSTCSNQGESCVVDSFGIYRQLLYLN